MSISCPTAIGDLVYLRTSLRGHQFSAFNASSGALSWVYEPKGHTGIVDALSPMVLNGWSLLLDIFSCILRSKATKTLENARKRSKNVRKRPRTPETPARPKMSKIFHFFSIFFASNIRPALAISEKHHRPIFTIS